MILDANKLSDDTELNCDLCIVGAGAAGITLALEFANSNIDVILLEAGKINNSGKSQNLYKGTVNDRERHLPTDQARYRQLGGTTSMWGGRCIPYDSLDFEHRSFVPYAQWPITLAELDPYYKKAHVYCQCGEYNYNQQESIPNSPKEMIPGFKDGKIITTTIERWSPPTNFGKEYKDRLQKAPNIRVFLKAIVTEIESSESGEQASALRVKTHNFNTIHIKAKSYVLCGGGFEVTRLLLASNKVHKMGIGNHSDWLGRCYMPHIHGAIAKLTFKPDKDIIFGYEQDAEGTYCRRRLCLSEATQRKLEILNMYFLLDRPLIGDPKHGDALLSLAFIAKRLKKKSVTENIGTGKYGMYWAHIKNILTGSAGLVSVLPQFSRKRFLQKRRIPSLLLKPRNNAFSLYFQAEQAPNPESRITLTNETDCYGMPCINIDFKISDLDVKSIYQAHQVIGEELATQDCGSLEFNSEDPIQDIRNCHAVMGHHIGTTRMSADSSQGVVDNNCKIHNVNNLYIASSSVFATSSQANPVLTTVALTLRLADHLKNGLNFNLNH
jgi:choline dehydrogenase-like flavoprotein